MNEARNAPSARRRVRITPAAVIATAALVFAAGGGAYATTSLGGTVEWAIVTAHGKLARGNGGIGASRHGPGNYKVLFFDDVRDCAYKATLGNPTGGVPPVGDIGVARMPGVVNGVLVRTTNAKGAAADEGFHVAATC
jgi:hypothetical protein